MKRSIKDGNYSSKSELSVSNQSKVMKVEKERHTWQLTPILSDKYYQEIEKEFVYVAEILDRKEASHLVKDMSQYYPIPNLIHLKRVRSRKVKDVQIMDIILLPVSELNKTSDDNIESKTAVKEILSENNMNLSGLAEYVNVVAVPKTPPLTRKQYKDAMVLWPTQFHEDKYTAKILSGELFNEEDKDRMESYMREAIESAERIQAPVGAVIVDPSTDTVICKAVDLRRKHPLQHAVMVAIDLVAKSQGGGAWSLNAPELFSAQKQEYSQDSGSLKCGPYLCTGYDLYLTREPCTMCAMALVHSRIHRVFYGCYTTWGKLGTCLKLHTEKGLNHHFEVWKGVLEKECRDLSDKYDIR